MVLFVAALACHFSLKLVFGSLMVQVLLEIIICSVVINAIFLCAFYRTTEFEILKNVIANIFSILIKKK